MCHQSKLAWEEEKILFKEPKKNFSDKCSQYFVSFHPRKWFKDYFKWEKIVVYFSNPFGGVW